MNIGVLVSGRGTNLRSIIQSIESGRIRNAQIKVVISSRADAPAREVAAKHNINEAFIDPTGYKGKRWEYDLKVINCLEKHGVTPENGLVLLAGYMRILSPEFVKAYRGRVMNIHPSLLPSFPGVDAQKQALEHGAKITGCTVHFVDEGMDTGPIILQASVPVKGNDTVEALSTRILEQEHRLYPEAVRLFVEGKLMLDGRRVKILL